jgi:hypothetical protein
MLAGKYQIFASVMALTRCPALAPAIAARAVPSDVIEVMRVAADADACAAAAAIVGVPAATLEVAAKHYLKQILLHADADDHRILGVTPDASREEARRNLTWLLRWLHPDRNRGWDAAHTRRIVAAWHEISTKSPPGRATPIGGKRAVRRSALHFRWPWIVVPVERHRAASYGRRLSLTIASAFRGLFAGHH